MSKQQDGGPAFPTQNGCAFDQGMSLRDWFAGMALQGLLTQRQEPGDYATSSSQVEKDDAGIVYKGRYLCAFDEGEEHDAAYDAYMFADAMLAAREGGKA